MISLSYVCCCDLRNMASTFVRKNKQVQSHANSFLQSVIREAEQKAGFSPNRNNNNYIDSRDQERGIYIHVFIIYIYIYIYIFSSKYLLIFTQAIMIKE